jgi:hypothetical protein
MCWLRGWGGFCFWTGSGIILMLTESRATLVRNVVARGGLCESRIQFSDFCLLQ